MPKIIFIYNANSGLANGLIDVGRRVFQPKDYPCALCMITYGPFGMKHEWKQFVRSLPYDVAFLHKDEFSRKYPTFVIAEPGLLLVTNHTPHMLLDSKDFTTINDLKTLKVRVQKSLE
jgi:hypothetical protein